MPAGIIDLVFGGKFEKNDIWRHLSLSGVQIKTKLSTVVLRRKLEKTRHLAPPIIEWRHYLIVSVYTFLQIERFCIGFETMNAVTNEQLWTPSVDRWKEADLLTDHRSSSFNKIEIYPKIIIFEDPPAAGKRLGMQHDCRECILAKQNDPFYTMVQRSESQQQLTQITTRNSYKWKELVPI